MTITVDAVKAATAERKIQPAAPTAGWHGWPKEAPVPAIAPFDAKQARKHQEDWAAYLGVRVEFENTLGMKFILIPPGEFMMGTPAEEVDEWTQTLPKHAQSWVATETPIRRMVIDKPFYLGCHEATYGQFKRFVSETNFRTQVEVNGKGGTVSSADAPEGLKTAPEINWRFSKHKVSEDDAVGMLAPSDIQAFVKWLSDEETLDYRIPAESQWEFACRAGTTTPWYCPQEDLAKAGWFDDKIHPVGKKLSNPFGLYDMYGNVQEQTLNGQQWVERGITNPNSTFLRSAARYPMTVTMEDSVYFVMGMRIVVTVESVKKSLRAPKRAIAPFDAKQARKHQEQWAAYLGMRVEYENTVGMKFALIPPGEFTMGTPKAEIEENVAQAIAAGQPDYVISFLKEEGPQRLATIDKPFLFGVHEVTQKAWLKVMGKNPSANRTSDDLPVENISFPDAVAFCNRLSEREGRLPSYRIDGEKIEFVEADGYRLPIVDEWEYACRGGSTTKYFFGDDPALLSDYDWFSRNSSGQTQPVGRKRANPYGLHELHGNVSEFALVNKFSTTGAFQSHRGGDAISEANYARSAVIRFRGPLQAAPWVGLRVLLPLSLAERSKIQERPLAGSDWHGWPKDAPAPAIVPFDAKQAKKHQDEWAEHLGVPVEYENTNGMKFVLIPPGEFTMGSTEAEIESALKVEGSNEWAKEYVRAESPQHKVILTEAFYLGIHEVTQRQFELITGENPSHFSPKGAGKNDFGGMDRTNCPVENIRWIDAAEFCIKLSEHEKLTPCYLPSGETVAPAEGTGYRLPKEAQWEFACRAGTTTRYWTGDKDEDLLQAAWFGPNAKGLPQPVGSLRPNPLGLYDVHGNIWEWVHDWWDPGYYGQFRDKPAVDPSGPTSPGTVRMLRGGNWTFTASDCRSAGRLADNPAADYRSTGLGFRVSISVDAVKRAIKSRESISERRDFALHFGDAGERLEFPELKFPSAGPWTVEGWVTPRAPLPSSGGSSAVVFQVSDAAVVVKNLGGQGIKWSAGGPATKPPPSVYSDETIDVNKRVHVALTCGPEGVSFYLNGVLQGQPLQLIVSRPETSLRVCRVDPKWHAAPFHGELDEVRVSSVVRYREKFTPKPRFETDADTLALYHFDESEGDVLKDSSGKDR
ncbi:MAG: SUMF1/EgtB/PvdO family nonheme iron enzyme, partial [Pirellulaceae bacterium]|nr:SUMF1/EgtB/PvdO family nonheme iron enzyme [Pirellulaceae bacterium]